MKISLEWLSQYMPGASEIGGQRCADALLEGGLPVESIESHGHDTVIDVEVTSNRSDCLSHVGVAREVAALLNQSFKPVEPKFAESSDAASAATSVQITAPDLCPYYSARIIKGVKIGPSPAWMIRRLESIGLRAINNVADITNYVLMELGQPLHAFDFDLLRDRRIVVRRAIPGEKIVSIDGKTRELAADMLVIADALNPVAVAGVMGGKDSEVTERTVNVLLESARFDPLSIRKTSRALTLRSDSSYRFERGLDPALAELASLRAAQLMAEIAGGQVLAGVAAAGSAALAPRKLVLRMEKIQQVLGIAIPAAEALDVLKRLGFAPVLKEEKRDGSLFHSIEATVPSHRLDIAIEVDLVEEVARVVGYARIPTRRQIEIQLQPPQPQFRAIDMVREALVAAGYFEALTFSWVSDALRDDFRPAAAAALLRADESVRKDNAFLRTSLLPGLLEAVRRNETVGNPQARLFEMGQTFWINDAGTIDERRRLAIVGSSDYREVRGVVEAVLHALDASRPVTIVPDQAPGLSSAATGRIQWGQQVVGFIGKLDRAVAGKLDLRENPVVAELELALLIEGLVTMPQVQDLAKFPAVKRDLSLVVDERIRYEQIDTLVRQEKLSDLEGIEYITTWRGKQLGEGKKSVTIQLVFRSREKTLTSEQVESSVQQVIAAAKGQGWALRE